MSRNLVKALQEGQQAAPAGAPRNLVKASMFPGVKPMGPVAEDEEMQASYGTRAKGQFVDDPNTRMRIYAEEIQKKYFPDKPVEDVLNQNMRIMDGNIVYTLGEAGDSPGSYQFYMAEPQGMGGQIAQSLPAAAPGAVIGGVLSAGGAVSGAASPIPGGAYLGATGGAAIGEAAGEGYRKAVGSVLFDEPQTVEGNVSDMATAAAWGAGGELFFKGLGKLFRKAQVNDIGELDMNSAQSLEALAKEHGITLTPAQSSGLRSLMARQKVLMNSPEGQDIMKKFFDNQNEQIQTAVYSLFDTFSPVESPREGFQKGIKELQKRREQLVARRAKVAEKEYSTAFSEQSAPIDVSPLVNQLKERLADSAGGQQRAINAVLKEITSPTTGELKTSLRGLHNAKVEIDRLIQGAQRGTGSAANMQVAELEAARRTLLNIMDQQSPAYAKARKKFEIASKPINKLDESVAGDIMKFDQSEAYKVGRTLFSEATGPAEVRNTMRIIRNMNPEAADAVLRGYLQQTFEKALKETQEGTVEMIGGKARKALFGTILDRRMLRAAMEPEQYRVFTDLMEVLQATTRGMSKGSDTAFNQAQREAMKQESKTALTKAGEITTLSKQKILDGLEQVRLGKYTEEMAKLFTSGDSLMDYRKAANVLKQTSPNSKAWWSAMGTILGGITGQQFTQD